MAENQTTANAEGAEKKAANSSELNLNSFFGQKAGMTRIFDGQGNHVPVTVIKLIPNYVSQVKTRTGEGYEAYQIAYQQKREKLICRPAKGHLAKAKIETVFAKASEVQADDIDSANLGKKLSYSNFEPLSYVDVTGISKGKGFQGVMKRYNFAGGPGAHGSKFHRTTGSIGNRATPGRVFKNKKMPGHMGAKKQTVQNIMVVEVNVEKGYMLLRGGVPGSKNSFVRVAKALKK